MDDRYISLQCLNKIIFEGKLSHEILNEEREKNTYTNFDYIEKIVKGVLENINEIDSNISTYSKIKIEKIKPIILLIIRQSIYEIKFMDSIPSYATINEAGKLVKKYKLQGLLPYVNGVLRAIDRNTNNNEIKHTHINKQTYIRINTFNQVTIKNIENQEIQLEKYNGALNFSQYKVYSCKDIKNLIQTEEFVNGDISIQDASSIYLVEQIYNVINDKIKSHDSTINILDTCAAPGGKSMALYHLLNHNNIKANFTLCDKTKTKIDLIQKNIKREGINAFNLQIQDATNNNTNKKYDLIICDVPCSGLGVISKKQDILLKTNKLKIKELQNIQKLIIDSSIQHLNDNAIFSYSTCTTTKEENEENTKYILETNKNLEVIFEKRIMPHDENNCDGFYMAIFLKTDNK